MLSNKDTKNRYEKLLYNLKQSIRQFQGKQFKLIDCNGQEYLSNTPGTLAGNRKLKIYGRLDCQSAKRWIEKGYYISNRVFFQNEGIAIAAGYRPCAKCMPDKYKEWKNDQIRKNRFQMCADQRTQFMSEEVSQEFRDLLQLCSNQLYLDEDGMVKQKKKKL